MKDRFKSEPSEASIDDLVRAPDQTLDWTGVRSYQARNFMRDDMTCGDGVLFYHSSCAQPGIAGIARISSGAAVDPTQWDTSSPYHDAKSTRDAPRWLQIQVQLVQRTPLFGLQDMRAQAELSSMLVLRRGNRLSITPVTPEEWRAVLRCLGLPSPAGLI